MSVVTNRAEDRLSVQASKQSSEVADILEASTDVIDALSGEWSVVSSCGESGEPFFQPYWFSAYARSFGGDAPVVLGIARRGDAMIGVLPLQRKRSFFGGVPAQTLSSLSGPHSCRFDLCFAAGEKDAAAGILWNTLRNDPSWQVIEALNVPQNGGFESIMRCAANDGCPIAQWRTLLTPYLEISSESPFQNCPQRTVDRRARLRSYYKKLEKLGNVEIVTTAEYDETLIDTFIALEVSGWKGRNGGAIGCSPKVVRFYKDALRGAAAAGHLRMQAILVGNTPVSMELGLFMNRCFYSPKFAYNEDFAKCSPGNLMNRESIRIAASHGAERYDFLGPCAPHKMLWTETVRPHANCYIFRPSIRGRFNHFFTTTIATHLRKLKYSYYGDPQKLAE
jgi:CelD/BcsL family acetyltransferase involved in cellulose biosynthesis